MSTSGHHCPFLNRTDPRCGKYLSIEHLGHAFDYCFDGYAACPVYLERLVERRMARADAVVKLNVPARRSDIRQPIHEPTRPAIQVTVRRATVGAFAGRDAGRAADRAAVSASLSV